MLHHARKFDELIDQYCNALEINLARQGDFELHSRFYPGGWVGGHWHEDHSDPEFVDGEFVPKKTWVPLRHLKPRHAGKILVQIMPEIRRRGPIHLMPHTDTTKHDRYSRKHITHSDKLSLKLRHGTIIAKSKDLPDSLEVGQDVCFSSSLGIRYYGKDSPFHTGAFTIAEDDMVRIFEIHPRTPQIVGVVRYGNLNRMVGVLFPGDKELRPARIVEESALLNGNYVVAMDDGSGHEFVHASWLYEL